MGTNYWQGGATAVAQVDKFTPATVEIGDTFTLTVTNEKGDTTTISFVATATTVANVVAGLVAAWNASTHPYCTPITAADVGTTYLTLTADTAGVPFYVASSTTDGGGNDTQTLTRAAVTANVGPNDYGTALNWSLAAIPVNSDDVVLENGAYDILYGLLQTGVTLNSFKKAKSFTGKIGQPTYPLSLEFNAAGTKLVELDYNYNNSSAAGSPRCNLKLGTEPITINVYDTCNISTDTFMAPTRLTVIDAAAILNVYKGQVGVGTNSEAEAATLGTINALYTDNKLTDVRLTIGAGVTWTTFTQRGGTNVLLGGGATVTASAGALTKTGSGNVTTLTNAGATITWGGSGTIGTLTNTTGTTISNTTGTITTCTINGGTVDLTQLMLARTVSTLSLVHGTLKYNSTITITTFNKPASDDVVMTAA